jgi:bifunctional non-homologous end joining protein LigD
MSPFVGDVPREDATGAVWVRPTLVCEVQSLGLTRQGRLRQPAYRGLRPDLTPLDVDLADVPRA